LIPGVDMAGNVEAVGQSVTQFKPGDEVYGSATGPSPSIYAFASLEPRSNRPTSRSRRRPRCRWQPPPLCRAFATRDASRPGQKVLINGASGGVGTFAVQIAKSFGAEVTGVCSTCNVETVRSPGAVHVIDYTRNDFVQSGQRYDLILDGVGNLHIGPKARR